MTKPRLIGPCRLGDRTRIDPSVIIGHPSKSSQLSGAQLDESQGSSIGDNCILRSNTVIYEDVIIGHKVQTAHNVVIREGARIGDGCVFGANACVLDHAILGENVRVMEQSLVCEGAVVGNDVFIAPHVSFTRGRYMLGAFIADGRMTQVEADEMERRYADPDGPSVIVGDDVRIGANSVILAGVKLGNGSIIAAGSVVSLDIPENHMFMGNPGRILPTTPPPVKN